MAPRSASDGGPGLGTADLIAALRGEPHCLSRAEAANTTRLEAIYILFHPRDKTTGALIPYGGPRSLRRRPVSEKQQTLDFWRARGFPEHQIPEVMRLEDASRTERLRKAKRAAEEHRQKMMEEARRG